jgi:hypothetical protein
MPAEENVCPRCGARFVCGAHANDGPCWCARLPPLPVAPDPAYGCLCPDCVGALLKNAPTDPA